MTFVSIHFRKKKFRPNAAVIISNGQGQILLCERYDKPGQIQTVQGGIDEGETAEQAAARELKEELGLQSADFAIKAYLLGTHKYEWTPEIQKRMRQLRDMSEFSGQEQHFFLVEIDPDQKFDLDFHHREFSQVWWGSPQELVDQIWHRKRPGIEAALEGFDLI
ncbi:MAG: NUDIX domain-containing protein [Patescibacteria group bacterium]